MATPTQAVTPPSADAAELPPSPTYGAPDLRFSRVASERQIRAVEARLRERGFDVVVVDGLDDARREVLQRIPPGATVLDAASRTLAEAGIPQALAAREDEPLLKVRLRRLDRVADAAEIRWRSQAPDIAIGSVHAVSEAGEVLVASATGWQFGPYIFGAGRVIWVVGAQKVVSTFADAMERVEHYALPLEDVRARGAYGKGSRIRGILVLREEPEPGRTTVILVRQNVGF